jgi:leader peptidase (prepilin peptidase) / N-methyltransferase
MDWLAWAEAAGALIAGLAAGFVVTVLIARIPAGNGVGPPFRCQGCGAGLRAADMIPVLSWLRLRGRCREGQEIFGGYYPMAELITAGLFLALWLRFGPVPLLAALAYLAILTVALSFIDAAHQRLPDALTLPAYPIALILLAISVPFVHGGLRHLVEALIGMAVTWSFFFLQALIYPSGIGWGDVKLSGILGLYLGWFGIQALVYGIVGGYLLAAVAGLGLIVARRATRKTKLAFGPFLLIATMAVIIATGM